MTTRIPSKYPFRVLIVLILALSGMMLSGCDQKPIENTVAPPTPTSGTLVLTIIPLQKNYGQFRVQDDQIMYSFEQTLDLPCNYVIRGQILNATDDELAKIVVNAQMVSDLAPEQPGYAFPYEGPDPTVWDMLLPNWTVDYTVWLTLGIGGEQISPTVYVETQGCGYNVATLNFIRVEAPG